MNEKLQIPYCMQKHYIKECKNGKQGYIEWYCPFPNCAVRKKWLIFEPQQFIATAKYRKSAYKCKEGKEYENKRVQHFLFQLRNIVIPEDHYAVLEILRGCTQHTHFKGDKGGMRVYIEKSLKHLSNIKEFLMKCTSATKGPLATYYKKVWLLLCNLHKP